MVFLVDLKSLLTPEAVTDLTMASIRHLPHHMPKTFRNSYTPIAAAGTDSQVIMEVLPVYIRVCFKICFL